MSERENAIIRWDDNAAQPRRLDEFIAHNTTVHFEAMGDSQFWIGIDLPDGRHFAINCGAVNTQAKGYAICEEDS